jgi:DNA-binding GntR family transcriptional regulator
MTATITPFPRLAPSLHAGLLESLRELINRGDLLPGARVPERTLCERFSVSRTPLRECLKVLAAEGLVELLPNRGARIASLGDDQMTHLFEVIAALEAEGGRLACARITPDAVAEIQGLHYRMYAHFLRGELPEYFALNQAIHEAIMRAAGNPVLLATYASLAGRITRARYMANRMHPDRWRQAMEEHGAILDALVARDGARLGPLLSRHLQGKRAIIAGAT